MKGHPLTTEPPLLMFGDMSGGSSNQKDGQKMTYRDRNRSIHESKVTNAVHPVDALCIVGGGASRACDRLHARTAKALDRLEEAERLEAEDQLGRILAWHTIRDTLAILRGDA